jgi:hypothetical protein
MTIERPIDEWKPACGSANKEARARRASLLRGGLVSPKHRKSAARCFAFQLQIFFT